MFDGFIKGILQSSVVTRSAKNGSEYASFNILLPLPNQKGQYKDEPCIATILAFGENIKKVNKLKEGAQIVAFGSMNFAKRKGETQVTGIIKDVIWSSASTLDQDLDDDFSFID